jgi:hypothetical protein
MLEDLCDEVSLEESDGKIEAILKGRLKGRTLVNSDRWKKRSRRSSGGEE